MFGSTLNVPVEDMMKRIAARPDAASGLAAAAAEWGGREGRAAARLADSLRRGESPKAGSPAMHSGFALVLLQSAAAGDDSANRIARALTLSRLRDDLRRRVMMLGWFVLVYWLCAAAVGLWMVMSTYDLGGSLLEEFGVADDSYLIWQRMAGVILAALLVVFALASVLWVLRGLRRTPRWIEATIAKAPMIGPALTAIDLAEFCELFSGAVRASWTIPQALDAVHSVSRSPRLRRWARRSSERVTEGVPLATTMHSFPVRGEWLSGVTELLGESTAAQWSETWATASDRMHELAGRRTLRVFGTLAPLATVIALAIASFGLVASLYILRFLIELISGLT